jgi:hypothetical protein
MAKYWELDEGKEQVDSARFFDALWKHFPEATTFYAEGTSIARDVKAFYRLHAEEGKYLPRAQTLFPRSAKFRCRISADFAAALSGLAQGHAEQELLDHLVVYKGPEELLFWHDAFANVLLVARSVPEDVVRAFAADLGLPYSGGQAS